MKVLWFTNTFLPEKDGVSDLRASGGWMNALFNALLKLQGMSMSVASARPIGQIDSYEVGGVKCFAVPLRSDNASYPTSSLAECKDIIRTLQPDVIHIHGTERFYGLLGKTVKDVPIVISLQGLLGPYSRWFHYFGNSSLIQIVKMHRILEVFALRGLFYNYLVMRKAARREREIIRSNKLFLGRTLWDKSYIWAHNHSAHYMHVDELLREEFWDHKWDFRQIQKHRIMFTAGYPRKGTEILLDALDILKQHYPAIRVYIAGNISKRSGYGRYLRSRLAEYGDMVVNLGPLNAKEMASELVKTHVYVSPSFIDNSPNALCEAQLVGVPVVSSYTGGVPSLVSEGNTGLFFPVGDANVCAVRISEIFNSDALANRLSENARTAAIKRHNPEQVVQQVLDAYKMAVCS